MGSPAAVMGDKVTATCSTHMIPNPASGAPQPGPPMPFSAPLTTGLVASVLIGGKAAAVAGSSGVCTPPHVGLHPSDPYVAATAQQANVVVGSSSVLFGGQPAASSSATCTVCASLPGTLVGTASTVLIGG